MLAPDESRREIIEERIVKDDGNVIIKKYEIGKFLGKGGFAKCFEVIEERTAKVLAAKIIDKSSLKKEKTKQKLQSEIKIHKSLNHQNIVKFESDFEDNTRVFILMELCKNQTLKEMIRKRTRILEIEARWLMSQLIPALIYLHSKNVIHRDIKLGNIFLGKNLECKIGDFGLAAQLENSKERRKTICGTPNYMSPDVLNSNLNGYSFEADIWSLGVVLYTVLIGDPPFETANVKSTYRRIKSLSYCFPTDIEISQEAKSLISSIFVLKPNNRPSLSSLMNHTFMTKTAIPKQIPLISLEKAPSEQILRALIYSSNKPSVIQEKRGEPIIIKTDDVRPTTVTTNPVTPVVSYLKKLLYFLIIIMLLFLL